jgi:hypothetical protein
VRIFLFFLTFWSLQQFFFHKFFFSVTPPNPAYSFLHTSQYRFVEDVKSAKTPLPAICLDHDHELLKPQLTSTWMPNGVGSMVGHSVVFAETQVRTLFNVVVRSKKEKKKHKYFQLKFNFILFQRESSCYIRFV